MLHLLAFPDQLQSQNWFPLLQQVKGKHLDVLGWPCLDVICEFWLLYFVAVFGLRMEIWFCNLWNFCIHAVKLTPACSHTYSHLLIFASPLNLSLLLQVARYLQKNSQGLTPLIMLSHSLPHQHPFRL
jgi:hypothetical protein